MKTAKPLLASLGLAPILMIAISGSVLANGVGDLYVASSSGVLEVEVSVSKVANTIQMAPAPQALAFSPDGLTLFVGRGDNSVTPIDIVTLGVLAPIAMPGPVNALAFPAGDILVGTMPTRRTLAFAIIHGGPVTESAQLPGAGNLIAADRRDARVAVAEAGKSWLEVVDPATDTLRKATVAGGIVALAIDRDRGGVLVATQDPNALLRIDLTSLQTSWTVNLPAAPTAVASMVTTDIVGGGSTLWKVDSKTAVKLATTKQSVLSLAASDEGSFVHVAEASAIEVFDITGTLERTLPLAGSLAPVAMAVVPRGSSLFLGNGAAAGPTPGALNTPGPFVTARPPTTAALDGAANIVSSPPFQGAVMVAVVILVACWLLIRWYDRRRLRG